MLVAEAQAEDASRASRKAAREVTAATAIRHAIRHEYDSTDDVDVAAALGASACVIFFNSTPSAAKSPKAHAAD